VRRFHWLASQYDHSTQTFTKKPLAQRWHVFGDGRGQVQRDVYSAFLARNASSQADENGVLSWYYETPVLDAAWVKLEPALLAQKLFYPQKPDSGAGDSIALCTRQPKSQATKPGALASGRAVLPVESHVQE
jgi:hypothetical protein